MYATTSPNRLNRSFTRDQPPTHAAGSRSPVNTTPRAQGYERPQTANTVLQGEPASSRSANGGYFFQPYSSPYVSGKKNTGFVNPNLVSSNVFYDHNYGYKGDLRNDRLLSPVRNDRVNGRRQMEGSYNMEESAGRTLTPPKRRADVSEDRFSRAQNFGQKRLDNTDDYYQPRRTLQKSVDSRAPAGDTRKNSPNMQRGDLNQTRNRNGNDAYTVRDDRSEASTVLSTLSSDGYVCPKCFNKHMANGQRTACSASKRVDQEKERRLHEFNRQIQEEEQARKRDERARRVEDSRNVKEKLDNEYNSRLEDRRSPPKGQTGTTLNSLFGKQDELRERQRAVNDMFRTHLKDQLRNRDEDREREKRANAQPYNTSLNVGNTYHNKYLDNPNVVRYTLQDQIEEKAYRQQREKELDKKSAQNLHEKAMRNLEEEDRFRREKQSNQKRELRDAYWQSNEQKINKQREDYEKKEAEKFNTDQAYNEYKRRQQDEEARTKGRLFDFKQSLLNQFGQSSYQKMHNDKLQQGQGTSFDPKSRTKKKYPCGDCNTLYEKVHLTKMG